MLTSLGCDLDDHPLTTATLITIRIPESAAPYNLYPASHPTAHKLCCEQLLITMRTCFTPITYNTHVKRSLSKLAAVHNDYDYSL